MIGKHINTKEEKIMRKVFGILTILLILPMVFVLNGCGGNSQPPTPQSFTLTLNSTGNGLVSGAGNFQEGTSVTVTAIPLADSVFDGWYQGTTNVSNTASYIFTMPSNNKTLTAKFSLTPIHQNIQTIWSVLQSDGNVFDANFRRITFPSSSTRYHEFRMAQVGTISYIVTDTVGGSQIMTSITFNYTTINSANKTFSYTTGDGGFVWVGGEGTLVRSDSSITTYTTRTSGSVNLFTTATTNHNTQLLFVLLEVFMELFFDVPLFVD
jgi:uncharacterized repeat protein (TIGR02543 family)